MTKTDISTLLPWNNSQKDFGEFCASIASTSKLRLAPTPSGFLHMGNAINFLLNWQAARNAGAKVLLRIDDLDADRKRPEYVQDIFDTLAWLGIDWDEGPKDAADFENNWSQRHRLPLYRAFLEDLKQQGRLFPCAKSRRELVEFGTNYPDAFRHQNCHFDSTDVSWRAITPDHFCMPNFVVRRRDGIPAYQIANVVDDLYFGITHAVRGKDLFDSTLAQRWLAATEPPLQWPATLAAGLPHPTNFGSIKFLFHPLLLDDNGEKLSKSAGAASLRAMREAGAAMPDFGFWMSDFGGTQQ